MDLVHVCAQEFVPCYQSLTIEDGLPSNETYFTLRDRRDNVWICTDNGLTRFDGNQLINYDQSDGLCSNVIFGGQEYGDKIWFYTITGQITWYNPRTDEFSCPEFNKYLPDILQRRLWIGINISQDTLIISFKGGFVRGAIQGDSLVGIKTYVASYNELMVHCFDNGQIGIGYLNRGRRDNINYTFTKKDYKFQTTIQVPGDNAVKHLSSCRFDNELLVVSGSNCYYIHLPEGKILKHHILPFSPSMGVEKGFGNDLYIGSLEKGYFYFENYRDLSSFRNWLPNDQISSIFIDDQNITWLASLNKGIFFIRSNSLLQMKYGQRPMKISAAYRHDPTALYVGTRLGDLFKIRESSGKLDPVMVRKFEKELRVIGSFGGELVVKERSRSFTYVTKKHSQEDLSYLRMAYLRPYILVDVHEGNLVMRNHVRGELVDSVLSNSWTGFDPRVYEWTKDNKHLYLGGRSGLAVLRDGRLQTIEIGGKSHIQKLDVRSMLCLNGDSILIGTKGRGILLCENGKVIGQFDTDHGFPSNLVQVLYKEANGRIWAGTNQTIFSFKLSKKGVVLDRVGFRFAWPKAASVTSINELGNHLLFGSTGGLFALRKKDIAKRMAIDKILIDRLIVNGIEQSGSKLSLSSEQNNIRIEFHNVRFTSSKGRYRYRLLPSSTGTWTETDVARVEFSSLEPAEYQFELSYLNAVGEWSAPMIMMEFEINPPLWQRWWFYLIILIASSLPVYLVLNYRNNKRREVDALRNRLILVQQKSLGSQLNPHFIFNTLNSIGNYVVENDSRNTIRFIAKFSKLMRSVFDNSPKNLIPVEEEVELARQYLDLESIRVGEKLKIQYELDQSLDLSGFMIPPITLQPLLENAIWHGLMPKERGGTLWLRTHMDNGDLICEIEDNGVGRKGNGEQQNGKHSSTKVLFERIEIIRKLFHSDLRIEYIDLKEGSAQTGTVVRLYIPKLKE